MINLLQLHPEKTCFVLKDETIIFTSEFKGVRPLMDYYKEYGTSKGPISVIDRIMGKGAILLAILCGATQVTTPIISVEALALAKKYHLKTEAPKVVDYIVNRDGTGRCPIESCLMEIDDIEEGYEAIKKTLKQLSEQSEN